MQTHNFTVSVYDPRESDMHICIIPGETGVCVTVEDTNGSNVQHYRSNLNDALALTHKLLRPVTTDDDG